MYSHLVAVVSVPMRPLLIVTVETSECEELPYRVFCTPHSVSPTVAEGILCAGMEPGILVRGGGVREVGIRRVGAGCYRISS